MIFDLKLAGIYGVQEGYRFFFKGNEFGAVSKFPFVKMVQVADSCLKINQLLFQFPCVSVSIKKASLHNKAGIFFVILLKEYLKIVAMKSFVHFVFILALSVIQVNAQSDTLKFEAEYPDADSVEYELIVLDPGYDSYLIMQPPMQYYSQQYYERWNWRYVTEWNARHMQALRYGDLYETYIDYRPEIDYGLELNYKLYYYFRFFEKENKVDLLPEKVF